MSGWTDEIVAQLLRLWNDGVSASGCAQTLNNEHGTSFSRSAIIGKIHRVGSARTTGRRRIYRKPKPRKQKKNPGSIAYQIQQKTASRGAPIADVDDAEVAHYDDDRTRAGLISFADLDESHHCKWPIGDPRDAAFGFCGAHRDVGPYCTEHAQRAVDVTPRRGTSKPWTWQKKRKQKGELV